MLKEILERLVKAIVDKPEDIKINELNGQSVFIFELRVGSGDLGKLIGKHGQNIQAIRTILNSASAKIGKRVRIEILE
ncbi:MAG: KH domain-containing protein [Calditrichaceae bacterium]|jgi:uncharacterized protein